MPDQEWDDPQDEMVEPEENEKVVEGFTFEEAERIQGVFVCSQCEGNLVIVPTFQNEPDDESEKRFWLICPDDGNIELIGRISRTTVAIRNEQGLMQYGSVIRLLSDLWGHLIPVREKRSIAENMKKLGF